MMQLDNIELLKTKKQDARSTFCVYGDMGNRTPDLFYAIC